MAFDFLHLDETTRLLMLAEVARDIAQGTLYLSPRLTDRGRRDWPELLRDAARDGDEVSLAETFRGNGRLREIEPRRTPARRGWGRAREASVPVTAAMTLAEGEFNRFYIRALCLRAIEAGFVEVIVYRAKEVENPRAESLALVGHRLAAADILGNVRNHVGEDGADFRVPGGPNSGLSIRLPDDDRDAGYSPAACRSS